jgi:hypothetical protein
MAWRFDEGAQEDNEEILRHTEYVLWTKISFIYKKYQMSYNLPEPEKKDKSIHDTLIDWVQLNRLNISKFIDK